MRTSSHLAIALCSWAFSLGALAAPFTWPSSEGPCAGTLQQCIDATTPLANDIVIATNAEIDENLSINNSLSLSAATGFHPRLAAGRGITGSSTGSEAYDVTIVGLKLTNAHIRLTHASTGTADITIEKTTVLSTNASTPAGIQLRTTNGAGTAYFRVYNNRLHVASPSLFDAAIEAEYTQNNGTALIAFNQVEALGDGQGWGILVDAASGASPRALIANNTLRGRFGRKAIDISEGLFSSTASTVTAQVVGNVVISRNRTGDGIGHVVYNGTINTQTLNNTVVGARTSISFTRWGGTGGGPGAGTISGPVENNLLAYGQYGLFINPEHRSGVVENYNLVFGNADNAYDAGPNDVTTDPRLLSLSNPRLSSSSPAINSGRASPTLTALSDPTALIGLLDADGLRRVKGSTIDIGAYEWGDASFTAVARPSVLAPHVFPINDARINGNLSMRLQTTARYSELENSGAQTNPRATGVYYAAGSGIWSLFNQDTAAPMPNGARYNVFAPAAGSGVFVQSASAPLSASLNLTGSGLTRDSIVLVTSNWNPSGGTGVYNNHTISAGYTSPNWYIQNNDDEPMLAGASFNVYAQDPSPNAFIHYVGTGNRALGNDATVLDHPLLNGIACANVHVTPKSGLHGDQTFDTYFDGSRWYIYNNSQLPGSDMAIGSTFFVVIDAAQVDSCALPLMSDGFED